jgi:hypothetical protein
MTFECPKDKIVFVSNDNNCSTSGYDPNPKLTGQNSNPTTVSIVSTTVYKKSTSIESSTIYSTYTESSTSSRQQANQMQYIFFLFIVNNCLIKGFFK